MKPARSLTSTGVLAARRRRTPWPRRSSRRSAVSGAHDLDQRHHRRRVEEVDAADLVGPARSPSPSRRPGSVEVLVARIASALHDAVELGEELPSSRRGPRRPTRSRGRSRRGRARSAVARDPAERPRRARPRSSLPRSTCLASDFSSAGDHGVGASPAGATRSTTSMPGLGRHLGDARAHDPRPDDPHPLHGHPAMLPVGRNTVPDDVTGRSHRVDREVRSRRYRRSMSTATARPVRHIELERAFNFRDLGGYPTSDGRTTKWHTLYRADGIHRVSEADVLTLQPLGLRTVIDLRTPERDR